jgi:hypothetical protein
LLFNHDRGGRSVDRQEVHERFERIRRRAYQKIDDEWRRVMAHQPPDPGVDDEAKSARAPQPVVKPRRRRRAPGKIKTA